MTTTNEELSDTQLFDEAVTEEEQQQVEQTSEEQTETHETQESTEQTQERQQVDDNAAQVPSWRVREINEEKRRLAEENERIKGEMAQLRQSQQRREPQKDEKKDDGIDPLLDPKGYAKQVREEIRNELLAERREESLQNAAEKYGDEFKEAYTAAQQKIDPALRARMQSSRDPGETLIKWHRESKQRAEIGDDLNAYNQRILEKALSDPAFLAKALEKAQGAARQQPSSQSSRPNVKLPPSLTGASRSNAALKAENLDKSDQELWDEIAG